jgi:hypothetical protein
LFVFRAVAGVREYTHELLGSWWCWGLRRLFVFRGLFLGACTAWSWLCWGLWRLNTRYCKVVLFCVLVGQIMWSLYRSLYISLYGSLLTLVSRVAQVEHALLQERVFQSLYRSLLILFRSLWHLCRELRRLNTRCCRSESSRRSTAQILKSPPRTDFF